MSLASPSVRPRQMLIAGQGLVVTARSHHMSRIATLCNRPAHGVSIDIPTPQVYGDCTTCCSLTAQALPKRPSSGLVVDRRFVSTREMACAARSPRRCWRSDAVAIAISITRVVQLAVVRCSRYLIQPITSRFTPVLRLITIRLRCRGVHGSR